MILRKKDLADYPVYKLQMKGVAALWRWKGLYLFNVEKFNGRLRNPDKENGSIAVRMYVINAKILFPTR